MFGEDWLAAVASTMGLASAQVAGYVMALIFTAVVVLAIEIATRGEEFMPSILETFVLTLLFTLLGWYDVWIGTLLALCFALMGAFAFKKGL